MTAPYRDAVWNQVWVAYNGLGSFPSLTARVLLSTSHSALSLDFCRAAARSLRDQLTEVIEELDQIAASQDEAYIEALEATYVIPPAKVTR